VRRAAFDRSFPARCGCHATASTAIFFRHIRDTSKRCRSYIIHLLHLDHLPCDTTQKHNNSSNMCEETPPSSSTMDALPVIAQCSAEPTKIKFLTSQTVVLEKGEKFKPIKPLVEYSSSPPSPRDDSLSLAEEQDATSQAKMKTLHGECD
jgi:hypothetical protein